MQAKSFNVILKIVGMLSVLAIAVLLLGIPVSAKDLDEIVQYDIYASVNDDGSLDMHYKIKWKVLDGKSEGPLEWVRVSLPKSSNVSDLRSESEQIRKISISGDDARIDLDRSYGTGETVNIDFAFTQDYLYQMNKFEEGYTVYSFTPGWFDDIVVDEMNIYWNKDKVDSFTPECFVEGDMLHFSTTLGKGKKFTINITYPNDAFLFKEIKEKQNSNQESSSESTLTDIIAGLFAIIIVIAVLVIPIGIPILIAIIIGYEVRTGFGTKSPKTKTTRTKIEYYESCPGCGGTRKEGAEVCAFCGRNMVKKREVITEEELKDTEKDALKFTTDGEYKYNSPNVYVRVVNSRIPFSSRVSRAFSTPIVSSGRSFSGSSSHSSHSSHHSSCVHSSCACACACACAGGGRAGCSNKDFYNSNLKTKYFVLKNGYKYRN